MNALELLGSLAPLSAAANQTPGASMAVCRDGKLQYLARGSFIQVDNETTNKMPDFTLYNANIARICRWLAWKQGPVAVERRANNVVVSAAGVSTGVIAVGQPGQLAGDVYENISEVVFQNKVSNDYWFNLTSENLAYLRRSLGVIVSEADSNIPTITVSVDGPAVVLSLGTRHGMTKETIQTDRGHEAPATKWTGVYSWEAFALAFTEYDDFSYVKISYSDNSNKVLSPLMVEYASGVTQVLAPVWH